MTPLVAAWFIKFKLKLLDFVEHSKQLPTNGSDPILHPRWHFAKRNSIQNPELNVFVEAVVEYLFGQAVDGANHFTRTAYSSFKQLINRQRPLARKNGLHQPGGTLAWNLFGNICLSFSHKSYPKVPGYKLVTDDEPVCKSCKVV